LWTAEQFMAKFATQPVELVNGVVRERPMTYPQHGKICLIVGFHLMRYLESNDIGHAMCNDSRIRTTEGPDSVRGPDVCFFHYDRLPRGEVPVGLLDVVPNLAIEVKSPSNRWSERFAKVAEYLAAGVEVVVIVDAEGRTVSVYRDAVPQEIHRADEVWTVPEILPGFAVPVARFFE
jgi:Uma2 family endonuclease